MPTIKDIIIRKPTAGESQTCKTWPIWSHGKDTFDWEYNEMEKCLILEGRVTICDRPDSGQQVHFAAGDYVVFPTGLKCVWKITEPVKKHYDFE